MGALHEGHLALIRRAVECGIGPVVVSVFVNPKQFGPGEDFDRYPRTLERDATMASDAGAEIIFAPNVETMYPPGLDLRSPALPPVATEPGLEDAHRPGHFEGVCQVVARLFDLTMPRVAIFGEKDYQQLRVIEAMVAGAGERWPGLEIVPHETIREPDGLAMSSRNAYLNDNARQEALALSLALDAAATTSTPDAAERAMREVLAMHQLVIDYAAVCDAITLLPIETFDRPARALIAARVGEIRLIDNRAVGAPM